VKAAEREPIRRSDMAKKRHKNPGHYEYIRAVRDGAHLTITYRLNGAAVEGSESHDEDVSDWTRQDIERVVRSLLSVDPDDPVKIDIGDA
jgi:hypothetical protein